MKLSKRTVLAAVAAVLVLTALPFASVSAAEQHDASTPPQKLISNERLERNWQTQIRIYNRLGQMDQLTDKVQKLIDRAKASGRDVSSVQAALDAFKTAAKDANPIYEDMKGIISSHQGFDENGKVTDGAKALETVKTMHVKIQQVKNTMNGTGRTLREAVGEFRKANPRPQPAATPSGA
jgi:hypothetical protein